jgi:hypothetical protein
MAEHASKPIRRPPVSESDTDADLVFKTVDDALVPAAKSAAEPSDETLGLFGDQRDQMLAQSLGIIIAELRREWRQEIKRLERENIELRARVDTLTTILAGGNAKSADVVELPKNFLRRTHDNAA